MQHALRALDHHRGQLQVLGANQGSRNALQRARSQTINICLIGPRGVGKTRTARRLAILMRRPVVSTDVLVSYECGGKSIPEIIRSKGGGVAAWRFFRRKELEVLRKISTLKNVVVDCGGGVIVDLDAGGVERYSSKKVRLLRKNALVVWLKADLDTLAKKNASDPRRPALGRKKEKNIMSRRRPFYSKAAHVSVPTDGLGAKALARRILKKISPKLKG